MLNLSITEMIFTVVNLFILYFLLKKFLFKPVTAMIERRQQEIENDIATAASQKKQAEQVLQDYNNKLSGADAEADALIAKAKTHAEQQYQAMMQHAKHDMRRLEEETQDQLIAERAAMLVSVRNEVASLAVLAASKVSGRDMDSDDDYALVESFLSEVGERR